nr:mechanosensitive ion channel [Gammaproteobacteria bacterium]
LVTIVLWLFTRALLWIILRRKRDKRSRSRQVGHRLASYGYTFFTTLLILVGVMVVLYIRGDLLLLALAIIVLASIALSLRTILPKFVSEARLLLNIGAIREGERVIYHGLPLEVQSINVHSYLSNPELEGVFRLPLSSLKDMTSRPSETESWFPTNPGDVLKMSDGSLSKVVRQTTEFVELQSRTGPIHYYPTLDFLSLDFENLTRSGEFIIVSYFGVDYDLQSISLDEVPEALQNAIEQAYAQSRFSDNILSVAVDFHAAAASSLDYIIFVKADAEIAISRYAIERIAQQACVDLCNRKNWVIPFQQVVIHQGEAS